ncbi:3'-5' exonuclease [uncultured Xylophilus sp.]|uniref:3'-5' exonuclease n=1 Tax=uncultured Xylophilus sp. TaxID=296832 RepID=UPI0025F4CF78|nr:3'-5' exonuclease [uncultured Xylophilus sp.]
MTRIAVIDFETTGLSPAMGARATEVGIVILEDGRAVDRFQGLMNAGVRLSPFIESFTGITNAMVAAAPPAAQVMAEAARFVGDLPMAAHNASFDRKFWMDELARADRPAPHAFVCTVLLSRRLHPEAGRHGLGALAAFHGLETTGPAHRALADAETAAALLGHMQRGLQARYGVPHAHHALLDRLQRTPRAAVAKAVAQFFGGAAPQDKTPR